MLQRATRWLTLAGSGCEPDVAALGYRQEEHYSESSTRRRVIQSANAVKLKIILTTIQKP